MLKIQKAYEEATTQLETLTAENASLTAENASLTAENASLLKELEESKGLIAKLQEKPN